MPLRKLILPVTVALALAACSSDAITGPSTTPQISAPTPQYETTSDGLGSLGGGGRA
ncbi:MAG TPA: hypothetical protein VFS20_07675 [Longimicrobium sp.]|nr:hypothetical protein [Longimicrobium sp.]